MNASKKQWLQKTQIPKSQSETRLFVTKKQTSQAKPHKYG